MPARKDIETANRVADTSAVERSLEEFISRANSTLPDLDEGRTRPKTLLADLKKRRKKTDGATLVVLGSPAPLADVTEIVSRVAVGTRPPAPRRHFGLRLGAAFLAGAAAVLLVSRVFVGGPRPQKPAAPPPPVPAPVVTQVPVPKPVVEPIVTAEPAPPPAPAATPVASVTIEDTEEPKPPPAKPARAKTPPRPARPKAAVEVKKPKDSESLVDPFAN